MDTLGDPTDPIRIELLAKFLLRTGAAEGHILERHAAEATATGGGYREFVHLLANAEQVQVAELANAERFLREHVRLCEACATPLRTDGAPPACPRCARPGPGRLLEPVSPGLETAVWDAGGAPADLPPSGIAVGRIGPYEIVERIGSGGMGDVYRAFDRILGRDVALKLLSRRAGPSTRRQVRNFLREVRAAARLRHPNLVAIHQAGWEGEFLYFTMDLVRGRTLRSTIHEGRLPLARAIDIAQRLADAVQYAHDHGVVHRDIKPGNVMIDEAGQPLLLDFGIAFDARRPERHRADGGMLVGTPTYMAPEQFRPWLEGDAPEALDGRCDVHALGALLHEMVTGTPAFRLEPEESLEEFARRVLESEPARPSALEPSVPADLDFVVHKALARDRELRYATAAEFREDLLRLQSGRPPSGRHETLTRRVLRTLRSVTEP